MSKYRPCARIPDHKYRDGSFAVRVARECEVRTHNWGLICNHLLMLDRCSVMLIRQTSGHHTVATSRMVIDMTFMAMLRQLQLGHLDRSGHLVIPRLWSSTSSPTPLRVGLASFLPNLRRFPLTFSTIPSLFVEVVLLQPFDLPIQ